jgi:hypothetical protein
MPASLYAVSLDCSDAKALASFWSAVLDRPVDDGASEDFAAIGLQDSPDGQTQWMFHKVPEGKTAKNRFHPDLVTADLQGEVERLVGLGAEERAEIKESGYHWVTLTDPQGNEFDLIGV